METTLPRLSPFTARQDFLKAGSFLMKALDGGGGMLTKGIAASTTDPGALVNPTLLPLVEAMQSNLALARARCRKVPFNVPVASTVNADAALVWVPEGGKKPVSKLTTSAAPLLPLKAAGIFTFTAELMKLTDENAIEYFNSRLIAASTTFLDRQALDPAVAAVAGDHPASLTNGRTPVAAVAGNVGATVSAVLAALLGARPSTQRPAVLLSLASAALLPSDHAVLNAQSGLTLITTPGAAGLVVALDADGVAFADNGAAIEQSSQAMVEANDGAGLAYIDLWSHNLVGVRLDRFVNWQAEATAVQYAVLA